jgi:hypothetical protein
MRRSIGNKQAAGFSAGRKLSRELPALGTAVQ